jgi:formiminotetrahydrofolate cyclodeaminase
MMMQDNFTKALADPARPIPGGGAASAYAGSVALALFEKIIRVEMRRNRVVAENGHLQDLLDQVTALAKSFRRLRDRDAESYLYLARARSSGKNPAEVASALKQATDCPIRIMEQACKTLDCVSQAAEHIKKHLLSDLQVVCELLGAAGRGAYHIAQANLTLMTDPDVQADYQDRLNRLYDLSSETLKLAQGSILQRYEKF